MQIQVNSDKHIEMSAELSSEIEAILTSALDRFTGRITRIEVHLSDENGSRSGGRDKRCVLEARLAGLRPFAVSHNDETEIQAVRGAAADLKRALDSALGKLADRRPAA